MTFYFQGLLIFFLWTKGKFEDENLTDSKVIALFTNFTSKVTEYMVDAEGLKTCCGSGGLA